MKVALVTGAYKGLGFEWCKQLGKDGYTVILTARSLEQAKKAADTLKAQGLNVHPMAVDVSREENIAELASEIAADFPQLDLIINNAGINSKDDTNPKIVAKSKWLADLDANEIIRHITINSISPLLMVKHLRPLLQRSEKPMVVSISSWLGSIGIKETNLANYSYSVSKAALNMLNRSLSIELKQEDIIAIVVNPGWVKTDMGGNNAGLTPEESVRGVIDNVLTSISINDTGKFYQWDGQLHPW